MRINLSINFAQGCAVPAQRREKCIIHIITCTMRCAIRRSALKGLRSSGGGICTKKPHGPSARGDPIFSGPVYGIFGARLRAQPDETLDSPAHAGSNRGGAIVVRFVDLCE